MVTEVGILEKNSRLINLSFSPPPLSLPLQILTSGLWLFLPCCVDVAEQHALAKLLV